MRVCILHAAGHRSFWYFETDSAQRAAELADEHMAARCIADAEVIAVDDDAYAETAPY